MCVCRERSSGVCFTKNKTKIVLSSERENKGLISDGEWLRWPNWDFKESNLF